MSVIFDFSIIIPARNEETQIGHCLESIGMLDADGITFEVLVIDNGSSDCTPLIALEKKAAVFKKPGLTIAALRNFGARMAKGKILAFLDADCSVHISWLRESSRYLSLPDIVCFGSPPVIPDNATWVQKSWYQIRKKSRPVEEADWLESMNMFVRRDVFLAVGGFNENLVTCEDYDISLRLKRVGRIIADCRIIAVHNGEAATVRQFYSKELWRGKSNLAGFKSHDFCWKELPSVVFPILHVVTALIIFVWIPAALVRCGEISGPVLFLLVLWQAPLFMLAVLKQKQAFSMKMIMNIYFLLNIYFFARGDAIIRRPHW